MERNRKDSIDSKLRVSIQPNIGLDSDAYRAVVLILNHTLANEMVLAVKTRNAHWNVTGAGFLEQRIILNSQFTQLIEASEKIADRIRVLGGTVICDLKEFLQIARIKEHPGEVPGYLDLLADHEVSIRFLREDARKCSEQYEDEVSHALLVDILNLHEKMAWMLRSNIDPELTAGESRGSQG
ncbi:DNA-binding ferritin-like protein [Longilinea arvoryzae]|uniref:DNA-binding ferritin-like protein n=1 Tax=Longilinea arvoryzae TaxID=360412 RepID=A0A0S7BIK1_9CHLR|nr:DNA starvation/stationary phase protection protein [Longilinea arvoryzae]GAP13605.1 DNA-binding ferritin-like protein [Longilinea arvoryzae]